MDDIRLGRVARALRRRLRWRQADVATRAGVSQWAVSRLERGAIGELKWVVIQRIGQAVGLSIDLSGRWRGGGDLDRLLDADHAALQAWYKRYLESLGWIVGAEVTFSRYGERGSIDLLAFHPVSSVALVVEIKTLIADIQGILRPLDMKTRLAGRVAAERGWRAQRVVPCLLFSNDRTSRRRVEAHASLFARFVLRSHEARRWLRHPNEDVTGMLLFRSVTGSGPGTVRRVGRQRVRLPLSRSSVVDASERESATSAGV